MKKIVLLAVVCLVAFGCSQTEPKEEKEEKFLVVATTTMLGDAMEAMLDSTVEVVTLLGPGIDPHVYNPTKKVLDYLADADMVVSHGLHFEGRMQDIFEKMAKKKTVIFLGDALPESKLIMPEDAGGFYDPHIWSDVLLWKEALVASIPQLEESGYYNKSGADDYLAEVDELHEYASSQIQSIPEENRILLTAHDAFSYFAKAYGLEVVALQGISTVAEYGIKDVEKMVDLIVDREIKAVFAESSISPRSMEAVMYGVNQKGREVKLGGTLYADAPGEEGSGAETYITMVKHNVDEIVSALK
ncbi:MAG: zinc ABC transporter substrate-binding protein [Bacteroidota bacterium]